MFVRNKTQIDKKKQQQNPTLENIVYMLINESKQQQKQTVDYFKITVPGSTLPTVANNCIRKCIPLQNRGTA